AVEHPVLQRLGDVLAGDRVASGEIGDRARDLQHARVGARREPQTLDRALEKALARGVEATVPVEVAARELRVAREVAAAVARTLPLARGDHALAHLARAFDGTRARELAVGDRRHLDLHVEAIEQRAGDARSIALHGARRTRAGVRRVAGVAARARVHRADDLRAGGEDVRAGCARHHDRALLERLAQRLEARERELR